MYNCSTGYFQKAYGEYVLRYAVAENPQRIRTAKDGGGSTQKRVRVRTRSPKIDKEVNFWARMAVVLVSSDIFVQQKLAELTIIIA